ncbi:tetratricopeptide repeat protein [Hyphomicrobium sp.]|uniref:tetratricopeptide repeat protein n=1 Tax=Hyphomicrobium sp. TaxID=82 RepID=UPI0025C5B5AC|nr:tetratricopeptide repeat protein [Hyphomicrobium sp.]MCC7254220.1 tetratricopeptide repeat protein [Hyphomicrobium sp.]
MALAALVAACAVASSASSNTVAECFSENNERRIAGCSELIENPNLDAGTRSLAYAMRALALSLQGALTQALPDYDRAIELDPASSMALNNRAWVLYKLDRLSEGMSDVERSLDLSPASPHAHDTRAHINQALGERTAALRDYERAMRYGGEHLVRLYQCGLEAQGIYRGPIDGLYTRDVRRALEICVASTKCDPLPADEECRAATS